MGVCKLRDRQSLLRSIIPTSRPSTYRASSANPTLHLPFPSCVPPTPRGQSQPSATKHGRRDQPAPRSTPLAFPLLRPMDLDNTSSSHVQWLGDPTVDPSSPPALVHFQPFSAPRLSSLGAARLSKCRPGPGPQDGGVRGPRRQGQPTFWRGRLMLATLASLAGKHAQ